MASVLLADDIKAIRAETEAEIREHADPSMMELEPYTKGDRIAARAVLHATVNVLQRRVAAHLAELRIEQQRAKRARESADELIADLDARLSRLEALK